MKKRIAVLAAAAGVLATFGVAMAAVTFDPATGTGFVGKGDVQMPAGLNNRQMQTVHESVTFTYDATSSVTYTCEWITGPAHNRSTHQVTRTKTSGISATVASDSRKTGQWTGWNLNGMDGESVTGEPVPQLGDACPGNPGNGAVVVSVEDEVSAGGGLYAHLSGNSYLIWSPGTSE
jgi:hypothetical protein